MVSTVVRLGHIVTAHRQNAIGAARGDRTGRGRGEGILVAGAIRQQPRRYALLACATILVTGVLLAVHPQGRALATSGGDPYHVTFVTDTNPDPNIVETTIVADEASVDIGGGVTAHAQTFNGQIPGPTFKLKVGDTVIVHYENHLDRESGIHWHGIELSNNMDGTPLPHDQCPMAVALREKRPVLGCEAVAERPDRTRRVFAPYPTPLFDANGRLTGAVNMLVDITERKRAEDTLRESEARFKAILRRRPSASR